MKDNILNKIDLKIKKALKTNSDLFRDLYRSSVLSGGKRIRANLLLSFSNDLCEEAVDLASAIELLHAATLIHDDILDNSSLRRGKSSLFRSRGLSASILYGDYLFSKAFSIISSIMDPVINHEVTRSLSIVLEGEIIEQSHRKNISLSRDEYFSIIKKKTGELFGLSSKLGSILSEEEKDLNEKAYIFGLNTGIAYQIIDDYMDYFSMDDKSWLNDLKQGLVTLPVINLLEKCTVKDKQTVKNIIKTDQIDRSEILKIKDHMFKYNIFDTLQKEIDNVLAKSNKILPGRKLEDINDHFYFEGWLRKKAENVKEKYCNSRCGVCGA